MAKLTIIRGLPGSGKSTLARSLATEHNARWLEADMWFVDSNGTYVFDKTRLSFAHDCCQRSTILALRAGEDVIVSNTFTQMWEVDIYCGIVIDLREDGVDIEGIDVIDVHTQYGSIHNVPEEAMKRMADRWEDIPQDYLATNLIRNVTHVGAKKQMTSTDLMTLRESSRYPGLFVRKYKKKVFYDSLWNDELIEARGRVETEAGQVVIRPFTKVFNDGERADVKIDDNDRCVEVRKVNGFMAAATFVSSVADVVVSTTGSLDSPFVDMATELMTDDVFSYIRSMHTVLPATFLFEVVHPDDPHIIKEDVGVYLIGYRVVNDESPYSTDTEKERILDDVARVMNVKRPEWKVCSFGDIKADVKQCQHEGYMAYSLETGVALKLKSPHYLTLKAAARRKDIALLDKSRVDEEFYDLIDHLHQNIEEFNALDEQQRLEYMKEFLTNGK